jgi:AraC family transcriptional regulator
MLAPTLETTQAADDVHVVVEAELCTPGLTAVLFRRTVRTSKAPTHWNSNQHNLFLSLNGPVPGKVHLDRGGRLREQIAIGEMFYLPADAPFYFTGDRSAATTRTVVLKFESDHFDRIAAQPTNWMREADRGCFDLKNVQLRSGLLRIARELVIPRLAGPALIEGLAATASADLARHLHGNEPAGTEPLVAWRVRRITEYLETSGAPSPTVSELANICDISPEHLSRAFRKATGMSIFQHIESVRLRSAESLLANTDLKLKEIAHRLGFARSSSFTVAFRRATGEAPSTFRHRMRS